MKKLILSLGVFLAGMGLGYSQSSTTTPASEASAPAAQTAPKMDPATRADRMVSKWTQVCNLTPEQAAKIKPMVLTFSQTIDANRQKYGTDREGMMTANKAARENLNNQMKTVLSTEQMAKIQGPAQHSSAQAPATGGVQIQH